jgi:hypothetical protein
MIFRRLKTHVEKENWFAVGIDFCIVVIGVFIGLQVANWNGVRADRQIEAQYLERLQKELSHMIPKAETALQEVGDRRQLIGDVTEFLTARSSRRRLDPSHCSAVRGSHIFAGVIFYPPTIKELISTGRIVLIRDTKLRTAILDFDQTFEEMSQLREDIQIDRVLLAREHSDLVRIDVGDWENVSCDYEAMRESPAFTNDFMDNRQRYIAYADDVQLRQTDLLKVLGQQIAKSRGEPFHLEDEASNGETASIDVTSAS